MYFSNTDTDGLTDSFLTANNIAVQNNRVLDPLNKAVYSTPYHTAVMLSGTSILTYAGGSRMSLTSGNFTSDQTSDFTDVLAQSLESRLSGTNIKIKNTTTSKGNDVVHWLAKVHAEDIGQVDGASTKTVLAQNLNVAESKKAFEAAAKSKKSKLSKVAKAHHSVDSYTTFPERASYTPVKESLGTPIKRKVKKVPSKKPAKKPAKPAKKPTKPGKKPGSKKGIRSLFSWVEEISSIIYRAFF